MGSLLKSLERSKKKNVRLFYQLASLFDLAKPRFVKRWERKSALRAYSELTPELKLIVDKRIEHYNRLEPGATFDYDHTKEAVYKLSDLKMHTSFNGKRSGSNYCYDALRYMRCYDKGLNGCFVFGDVSWVPAQPSFVKSRPIGSDNANSVVLALNKIRHFNFIRDEVEFDDKQNMMIGVSYAKQSHRQEFLKQYFGHPMCRLGSALHFEDERKVWNIEHISIPEHLKYKFILCLEGNDVATNLKWVMSSNSVAVMPKPKYETWFMESELVGGVHYIEIKDDYSDLEEKLEHYIAHSDEAKSIIAEAHKFVDQFRNKRIEHITSMMVVENYFIRTKQL